MYFRALQSRNSTIFFIFSGLPQNNYLYSQPLTKLVSQTRTQSVRAYRVRDYLTSRHIDGRAEANGPSVNRPRSVLLNDTLRDDAADAIKIRFSRHSLRIMSLAVG
jgi:hypothetical protein